MPECGKRLGVTVLIAAAMLGLVGCSGSSPDGAAGPTTTAAAVTSTVSLAATTTTSPDDELAGAELTALLGPEDVQSAAGLVEVRRAGRNPDRGLGGDLNFVLPDGRPLLMVVVEPAASYGSWRADSDSYRVDLEGVGEAAFVGPAVTMNETAYLLVFRSGERTIGLLTYDDPEAEGWNNMLALEQLQVIARVIEGRL